MRTDWNERLGHARANSTLELMLSAMQTMPYFTTETMVAATGRSKQATGQAVRRLLDAQVIRKADQKKRSRVFDVPDVLEQFHMVERRLACPMRDIGIGSPVRPVPRRDT